MKRFIAPAAVFAVLMIVYSLTLAPGLFWADSPEFTACNEILGLPHSPSFPLYTSLGRVFHLLLPVSPALATNIYSAVTAAAAGVMFFLTMHLLFGLLTINNLVRALAAAAATMAAFLALPIWQSAVRAEVYALNILLTVTVLYCFIRVALGKDIGRKIRYALTAVFMQGLAMTNHSLLAVATLPMILALPLFIPWKQYKLHPVRIVASGVAVFVIGFSFYIFLPVRSNNDPVINTGQPKTIAETVRVITRTGDDYLPEYDAREPHYFDRLYKILRYLVNQAGIPVLIGFMAGIVTILRRRPKVGTAMLLAVIIGAGTTIWAVDFDPVNFDIIAYTGLFTAVIIGLGCWGLFHICNTLMARFSAKRSLNILVPALVSAFIVVTQFAGNLAACNLHQVRGPDRLARMILNEAPPGALLILYEDSSLMPLWYYHLAMGERPDLAIVAGGTFYRPSYRDEVKRLYPDLIYPPEFSRPKVIDMFAAVKDFCDLNLPHRPILLQPGVLGVDMKDVALTGIMFTYMPQDRQDNNPTPEKLLAMLEKIRGHADDLLTKNIIARMAFNYGIYFDMKGNTGQAFEMFGYAVDTDRSNPQYMWILGKAAYDAGRTEEAVAMLEAAVHTGDGSEDAAKLLEKIKASQAEAL